MQRIVEELNVGDLLSLLDVVYFEKIANMAFPSRIELETLQGFVRNFNIEAAFEFSLYVCFGKLRSYDHFIEGFQVSGLSGSVRWL